LSLEKAKAELARLSTDEQVILLELLEKRRRDEKFICYWEPFPAQLKALQAFTPEIKTFVVRGGNRSGKTELGAAVDIAWALGKKFFEGEAGWEWVKDLPIPEPPNNIWVVGLDFSTLRDVIWREKLLQGRNHPGFVPQLELSKPPNNTDFQIFFKNGSVITGKSADSGREKFQSASVDLIHIDEEPEKAIYDECYQRTADCAGKLLVTLTPLVDIASGVREPWVYDLHDDMVKGSRDVRFAQLSVLDNPYVPEEEKEKLKQKWAGSPEEAARLYGDFVQRSGLVYNLWDAKRHLCKPFLVPKDWTRIVSIDPANTGVTAAIWGAIEPVTNNLYLYREYYEKNLTISDHSKNILLRNRGEMIDFWLIDPKWGTQREGQQHKSGQQLYREQGIPARLAEVGNDFGLQISKEYVSATLEPNGRQPKLYVFNDLHNFRWEMEHYTWATFDRGEKKGLSKEKPVKRNDHLMNAFQYLCAGRFRGRARGVSSGPSISSARLNSYFQDGVYDNAPGPGDMSVINQGTIPWAKGN